MADLIDKEVLYNHFANLEAMALKKVNEHMHDEDLMEWYIWSAILLDRIASKNDVYTTPVVDSDLMKHGQWIEYHEPYTWMGYTYWSCSECGFECGYDKDILYTTNYCPNCGAKMDG